MKRILRRSTVGVVAVLLMSGAMAKADCPPDSVKVGNVCIDLYEASVWQIPPSNTSLVYKVQAGTATLADLTGGGATQLSPSPSCSPGFPENFPPSAQWTPIPGSSPPSPGVYAVSIPGVLPTACINWFQAGQLCRLSGKRLLTNLEWQDAAAGTPDPGTDNGTSDCNVNSPGPVSTGSRSNCKSSWGAFDMVGNLDEWVADWAQHVSYRDRTHGCTDSTTAFGFGTNDFVCFGGDGSTHIPAPLRRGGYWFAPLGSGVFAHGTNVSPSEAFSYTAFRCAR